MPSWLGYNIAAAKGHPIALQYTRVMWRRRQQLRRGKLDQVALLDQEATKLRQILIELDIYRPYTHPPDPVVNLLPIPGDWSDPIAP